MSTKAELLKAINGEEVEKVVWSPFLAFFFEHQSQEVQDAGQLSYMEQIGAAPLLRGFISPATIIMHDCDVTETEENGTRIKSYKTPIGTITEKAVWAHNTWFLSEHPVKNKEDLLIFKHICDHIEVISNVKQLNQAIKDTGDRGLHIPLIGLFAKSGFQSLLEHWIGTVNLVYAMMDYPELIKECIDVMRIKSNEIAKFAAKSDGEIFISWEDTSTTNISPAYYLDFIQPEIDDWCDILHASGKKYIQHACGHLRHLLPHMAKSKIDGIESMSPEPTGNIDVLEAIELLPEHMTIIGGLEPTFLIKASKEDLRIRIHTILDRMKGRRYLLANSDSCPPEVKKEQFEYIREILEDYNAMKS